MNREVKFWIKAFVIIVVAVVVIIATAAVITKAILM